MWTTTADDEIFGDLGRVQLLAANMITEPRFVGEGACRSVGSEEDSESANLLFRSGKLLSLIVEIVGEGDVGWGEAGGGHFERISWRRGGLARGLGGPYSSKSASIRLLTKLGVTGKIGEPLERLEGALSWEVGRKVRVGKEGASPGQMELMLGRMN